MSKLDSLPVLDADAIQPYTSFVVWDMATGQVVLSGLAIERIPLEEEVIMRGDALTACLHSDGKQIRHNLYPYFAEDTADRYLVLEGEYVETYGTENLPRVPRVEVTA